MRSLYGHARGKGSFELVDHDFNWARARRGAHSYCYLIELLWSQQAVCNLGASELAANFGASKRTASMVASKLAANLGGQKMIDTITTVPWPEASNLKHPSRTQEPPSALHQVL